MVTSTVLPALPALDARERAALQGWRTEPVRGADGRPEVQAVFALQGMHCAACASLVERALRSVRGVTLAEVHAARERARVQWDPSAAGAADLIDALRRAGYGALPASREGAEAARRREGRTSLWRLFVAAFCMMQIMMVTTPVYVATVGEIPPDQLALLRWSAWVLTLPVMLFSCGPFFQGAWRALRAGRVGMDVPVSLGMAITFVAGTAATFDPTGPFGHEVYLDSLGMFVTFLLAGRWLERRARDRAAASLEALLHRLPDSVERVGTDGMPVPVPVADLVVGDRVRVAAGQAFPGDGRLVDGHTQVDEALLTGESRPVERGLGDTVLGGSINLAAPVTVHLLRLGDGTRHGQIVRLLEQAFTGRPAALALADRVAGPFLVGVLLLAAGAAAAWSAVDPARALSVAVAVLIVTCPCALSIAAPAAWLAAAGALARRGVLVQRLGALEVLAAVDTVCTDKTGTLTCDTLTLAAALAAPGTDAAVWNSRAASLAAHSRHPLAAALVRCLPPSGGAWTDVRELGGRGVEATDPSGVVWRLGAPAWVGVVASGERPQVACAPVDSPSHHVLFSFDEVLREDAADTVAAWQRQGLGVRMLSGDGEASARRVAGRLGIADVRAGASPDDKLATLERLQAGGHTVLMVGDGLNDGPVLARADVSFALAHGSALAQQRADFIVLGSRLAEIPAAQQLARRVVRVTRQNLAWSAVYNAACVPLALMGMLPPWAAGAGMALSSLAVVVNALRLAR